MCPAQGSVVCQAAAEGCCGTARAAQVAAAGPRCRVRRALQVTACRVRTQRARWATERGRAARRAAHVLLLQGSNRNGRRGAPASGCRGRTWRPPRW